MHNLHAVKMESMNFFSKNPTDFGCMLKVSIEKNKIILILNPTWPIIIKLKKVDQQEMAKKKSSGHSLRFLGLIIKQAPPVIS